MIQNGIDTDHLTALTEVAVNDPNAAALSARVRTRWEDRYRTSATSEQLRCGPSLITRAATLPMDRPEALGGGDQGPAPGELLLGALGSCVAQAFIEGATMAGIPIRTLEIAVEGHLDLRGNIGVEGVRPGMTSIHLDAEVEADTDRATLDRLLAEAVRRSPIADSLAVGVDLGAQVHEPAATAS